MKKRFLLALSIAALFTGLASCDVGSSNGGTCKTQNVGTATTAVTGDMSAILPAASATNPNPSVTVPIRVFFKVSNSCGEFQSFFQDNTGAFEKEITVNTKYEGCNCDEMERTIDTVYNFKALSTGEYKFKFKKQSVPTEEFITHTVTITN